MVDVTSGNSDHLIYTTSNLSWFILAIYTPVL